MDKFVSAILIMVMAVFGADGGCKGADVPANSDRGDSAGDNQPRNACTVTAGDTKPAAQIQAGDIKYDIFVELQDADCDTVHLAGNPLNIMVIGQIDGQSARYLGGAEVTKDVNSPYHVTAFVTRGKPHDMGVQVSTNVKAWGAIRESEADFIHCHVNRDARPMHPVGGDVVNSTEPLGASGRGGAFCHFIVPVG